MAMFDLDLPSLQTYRPDVSDPADFDSFWSATVAEATEQADEPVATPVDNRLAVIDSYDLTYSGFGGTPVSAWLHVPHGSTGPLPTVVQYIGYSGGRGLPLSHTRWAQAGYAQLVMDTRGQGWKVGGEVGTPDHAIDAGLSHAPGFMTVGILDPATYYYRRVFTDAVRLLAVAAAHPRVKADQIILTGGSQGGGITLAAGALAHLVGVVPIGIAPDVPFLCHFARAVALTDKDPYAEITRYLAGWRDHAATAYRTLGYFDGVNFARRATAPALFSVALMDEICPPSTVFAAYNHYAAEGDIVVYPHNNHEGGEDHQVLRQLEWFAELTGS
jgi:cephalosporin-C deacetylase